MDTEDLIMQKWKQVKYIINMYAGLLSRVNGTYNFKGFPSQLLKISENISIIMVNKQQL